MEGFFRAVAIGLGVILGTLNPGLEPELAASLFRGEGQVTLVALLNHGVSPKMEEALGEGVRMALTLQVVLDGQPAAPAVTQTVAFLPLTRVWQVSRGSEVVGTFASRAEAVAKWTLWPPVVVRVPSSGFGVEVRAELSFPGRPDWKADLVWKAPAVWHKDFTGLSEIPY